MMRTVQGHLERRLLQGRALELPVPGLLDLGGPGDLNLARQGLGSRASQEGLELRMTFPGPGGERPRIRELGRVPELRLLTPPDADEGMLNRVDVVQPRQNPLVAAPSL